MDHRYLKTDTRNELVDVKLLYQQKLALLECIDYHDNDTKIEFLEGLVNYCESQLDHLDPEGLIWEEVKEEVNKDYKK